MLLGICTIAAAFTYFLPKKPPVLDLSAYRYRPFAFTQEFERQGSWSPDGKTIAFLQSSDDRPDSSGLRLMLEPSGAGAATQLADHAGYWRPVWSHDGSRVCFWKPDTLLQGVLGISGGIYSVSRGGGLPELVLKQNNVVYSFDLSPDGKSLALWRGLRASDGAVRSSVWISSPPGAEPHEYTPAPFAVPANLYGFVRFSPDGKWLLASMTTFKGDQVETWLLPLPAGSPRQIFRNVPWNAVGGASWMPDSRHLVFSASVAPLITVALWLADVGDESLVKLTDGSVQQDEPAVSPDGSRLLFTRVDEDTDIMELPADGSAPRKLLATSASELSPDWSPKGDEFAYVTERNGNDEIWLRNWPGVYERPVVTSRDFQAMVLGLGIPAISPDGTRIAYGVLQRDPKHVGAMYVSPRSGGAPTWIAEGGGGQTWSPDGQSLAFFWHTPRNAARPGNSARRVERAAVRDSECPVY
jgi:Tol biopolymer transport system component